MPINIIDSYLVELGAHVDRASFDKFHQTLLTAATQSTSAVSSIAGDFLKLQIAGTTAFATVGFGIIGFIDKLAMADQKTKLLAMQNMMSVQQYRAVSSALDVLGVSLDDVFYGTAELQTRFHTLIEDQKQLAAMVGPNYEQQMQQVRDVIFQMQRLELKGEYFGMKFASDLLRKLGFGDGSILTQLERLNDFVMDRMPAWSDELSTDVIPVMHDFWGIIKDTVNVLAELGNLFTYTVGVLSNDDTLQTQTTSFHQFATAVGDVVQFMATLLHITLLTEKAVVGLAEALIHGLKEHKLPDFTQHTDAHGNTTFDLWGDKNKGGGSDYFNKLLAGEGTRGLGYKPAPGMGVAQEVSKRTGIPADLIYGQMAFETGNFKHMAGKNNFSGIKTPGTDKFRDFESIDKFAEAYGGLLTSSRYKNNGILRATNGSEFAQALKTPSGTYYGTDSEKNYAAGVERYRRAYDISVGSIVVNVPSSTHTPEAIAKAVKDGVRQGLDEHTQQLMVETSGAYQ